MITKQVTWNGLKWFLTLFIAILIPTYWHYYGFQNFLWLSDIGLFFTVIGLWFNSALIMSMATVGILFLELVWAVDFFAELFLGLNPIDLSDYMFDAHYPLILRGISLFHIITPVIWICYMLQYGYDRRALYYFTIFYWINLITVYLFTDIKENINWVFLPTIYNWHTITQPMWVIILFVGFPLCLFLPMHFLCKKLFKPAAQ